jgi:AcrR family transcriptional regulator
MKSIGKFNTIKDKIVAKSREHFARFGLSKTSLNDIAKSINMGKSSLYYYFQSKEQLFESVLIAEADILLEKIRRAVDAAPTSDEKIRAFSLTKTQSIRELANIHDALKNDYFLHYACVQKIRGDYDNKLIQLMKTILDNGVKAGEYAIADTALTAEMVCLALKGMEHDWAIKNNTVDITKNLDKLLPILLYGIKRSAKGAAL